MSGHEERDPAIIEQRVKKYMKHNQKNIKIAGCANRSLQLPGSSWSDWVWMQDQTDTLQFTWLGAAGKPRDWAASIEHIGAKLVTCFFLPNVWSNCSPNCVTRSAARNDSFWVHASSLLLTTPSTQLCHNMACASLEAPRLDNGPENIF